MWFAHILAISVVTGLFLSMVSHPPPARPALESLIRAQARKAPISRLANLKAILARTRSL